MGFKKRLGVGKTTDIQQENGFMGAERKAWLYINRVKPHVTIEMVEAHIKKQPSFENEIISVKELPINNNNNRNNWKSFVVTAPLSRKDELYQPEFWPPNVGIKRFNFNLYKKNQPMADFL